MTETARRVALLVRPGLAGERLTALLAEAGIESVLQADPTTVDAHTLASAGAQVFLVALDPETEDALERFDEILADPGIDVIYEEAELAAVREGWEAARWKRHLVAKLQGHDRVLPPRPEGQVDAPGLRLHSVEEVSDDALRDFNPGSAPEIPEAPLEVAIPSAETAGVGGTDDSGVDAEWSLDVDDASEAVGVKDEGGDDSSGDADALSLEGFDGEVLEFEDGVSAAVETPSDDPMPTGYAFDPAAAEAAEAEEGIDLSGFEISFEEPAGNGAGEPDGLEAHLENLIRGESAPVVPDAGTVDGAATRSRTVEPPPLPPVEASAMGSTFGELSLADDDTAHDAGGSKASDERFDRDLADLHDRISGLELVDDSAGRGPARPGAVLVMAGIGGPDAVRQFLGALPAGFPRPVLVQQRLDGGRYDRLVAQMQRATSLPVHLAEPGQAAAAGTVYMLPAGMGLKAASEGLEFIADADALESLPSADSGFVLLSGSDAADVDRVLKHRAGGAYVAGQAAEGCYDAAAADQLAARGGETGQPAEIALSLADRWPA